MSEEWRFPLQASALAFVGTALFPRLAYRLRWPTRLGLRGVIAYVVFKALLHVLIGVAVRTWILPWARRKAQERELVVEELRESLGRESLGREPTDGEVAAELMERFARTRGGAG